MNIRKNTLRVVALFAALACGSAFAAWERLAIDLGGSPQPAIAVSSATSRIYVPLVQDRALTVVDGARTQRMEVPFRPTAAAYSAASGRIFVVSVLDNAALAIDEATGAQTPIAIGTGPSQLVVDDARGKVYVGVWGGIGQQGGGLVVIDSASLAVRTTPVGGAVTQIAHDAASGNVFLTVENHPQSSVVMLSAEGSVLARINENFRAYSLAADSRDGRIYVGSLSGSPIGGAAVNRVVTVYAQPGMQVVSRVEYPAVRHYNPLVFLVDPQQPGLYLASLDEASLRRIDANGGNLRTWALPLDSGVSLLKSDPATGRIFVSAPQDSVVGEFHPDTGTLEDVAVAGYDRFALVHLVSADRMLVLDASDGRFYLLRAAGAGAHNPLVRETKRRITADTARGIKR